MNICDNIVQFIDSKAVMLKAQPWSSLVEGDEQQKTMELCYACVA